MSANNNATQEQQPTTHRDAKNIRSVVQALEEEHKHEHYEYRECDCYHSPHSCLGLNMRYFMNILPASFSIYLPVHLVPLLLFKRDKLKRTPVPVLLQFGKSLMRSVLFLNFFQTLMILTLCAGNRFLRRDHPIAAFSAGTVSGLAVLFEKFERRKEMMLYCIPRSLECITNALMDRKLLNKERLNSILAYTFIVSSGFLMYFYQHQRKTVKRSIFSVLHLFLGTN